MTKVFTTYSTSSQQGQSNLNFGISHRKWGLRRLHADVRLGDRFEWHVIGTKAKGLRHGPRCQPNEWITSSIDVYVFVVQSPVGVEHSPLWPDEIAEGKVLYPYRFEIDLVANAKGVPTCYDEPIPKVISEGIRLGASRSETVSRVSDERMAEFVQAIKNW